MCPNITNPSVDSIGGIQVEYKVPSGDGPFPLIIMLHGWTGDEKSMWVFSSRLPVDCILISPRGLFNSSLGGFSWYPENDKSWPDLDDFIPALGALNTLLTAEVFRDIWDHLAIRLVGFSQGAALAYSFAAAPTIRIRSMAGLSGFVPNGIQKFIYEKPLSGVPVFVTHGVQDKIVSIERGRNGAQILQELGALVTYCEDDTGHRLSPNCFRGLQTFFQSN